MGPFGRAESVKSFVWFISPSLIHGQCRRVGDRLGDRRMACDSIAWMRRGLSLSPASRSAPRGGDSGAWCSPRIVCDRSGCSRSGDRTAPCASAATDAAREAAAASAASADMRVREMRREQKRFVTCSGRPYSGERRLRSRRRASSRSSSRRQQQQQKPAPREAPTKMGTADAPDGGAAPTGGGANAAVGTELEGGEEAFSGCCGCCGGVAEGVSGPSPAGAAAARRVDASGGGDGSGGDGDGGGGDEDGGGGMTTARSVSDAATSNPSELSSAAMFATISSLTSDDATAAPVGPSGAATWRWYCTPARALLTPESAATAALS